MIKVDQVSDGPTDRGKRFVDADVLTILIEPRVMVGYPKLDGLTTLPRRVGLTCLSPLDNNASAQVRGGWISDSLAFLGILSVGSIQVDVVRRSAADDSGFVDWCSAT